MTTNGYMYCPICGRELEAVNRKEVANGEHEWFVFCHDDIEHKETDMMALEHGVN